MPLVMLLRPGPVMAVRMLAQTVRVLFDNEVVPRRSFMLPNQAIAMYRAKDDTVPIPIGQVYLYNAHFDEPIDLCAGPDSKVKRQATVQVSKGRRKRAHTRKIEEEVLAPWRGRLQAQMPWWGELEDAAIQTEQHRQDTHQTPMEMWNRWILMALGGMVLIDIMVILMTMLK